MGRARPSTPSSTTSQPDARLILGDCVEVMATFPDASIDAVVCDPPYGLEFMGKEWDKLGAAVIADPASVGGFQDGNGGNAYSRSRVRFGATARAMQDWHECWAREAFRVLKPGGHLLAFGGTRTYHRMVVAIEDAGFEIRDSLHWIYGSGFPKSLDVSKAIDKTAGHWRGRAGEAKRDDPKRSFGQHYEWTEKGEPVTAAAAAWAGWGTALKPAHEPIVLARKPLDGTVAASVIGHGTGALNIGEARVGVVGGTRQTQAKDGATGREVTTFGVSIGSAPGGNEDAGGRWPANVVLSHLAECEGNGAAHTDVLCAPGCPVAELNEMSGESSSSCLKPLPRTPGASIGEAHGDRDAATVRGHNDVGGAARFFYIAKPKRRERVGGTVRNLHPTVKPIDLMRWLVRLATPPGGVVLDPFLGSGSTGCAAMVEGVRFIGIEQEQESYETAVARISDYAFAYRREPPART